MVRLRGPVKLIGNNLIHPFNLLGNIGQIIFIGFLLLYYPGNNRQRCFQTMRQITQSGSISALSLSLTFNKQIKIMAKIM